MWLYRDGTHTVTINVPLAKLFQDHFVFGVICYLSTILFFRPPLPPSPCSPAFGVACGSVNSGGGGTRWGEEAGLEQHHRTDALTSLVGHASIDIESREEMFCLLKLWSGC